MSDTTKQDYTSQSLFEDQATDSLQSSQAESSEPKTTDKSKKKNKQKFQQLGTILDKYTLEDKGGYITQEFQDFGYQLAVKLNDLKHKSLYIKMAKTVDRSILERALSFVADANSARSKAKLFMWKVKQIKEERNKKKK